MMMDCTEPFPQIFFFFSIVKAGIRIKPLILVITQGWLDRKNCDNHTVAF